jgi:hypothetical protein
VLSEFEQDAENLDETEKAEREGESAEEEDNASGLRSYFLGKNGMKWSKEIPKRTVRTRSENIITHLPGVRNRAKNAKTPLKCFLLFFDEQMITDVVEHTNQRISEKSDRWKDSPHYGKTDVPEIKAVFGLLYFAGVFKSNHHNLYDLWKTNGTGMEVFRCTMSQRRFEFLVSCLRFDNKNNREQRKAQDKLAPIRAIVEKFRSTRGIYQIYPASYYFHRQICSKTLYELILKVLIATYASRALQQ